MKCAKCQGYTNRTALSQTGNSMKRKEVTNIILNAKLVVVIRTKDATEVPLIIAALVDAGVKVMEVTSNTPDFEKEIERARTQYPEILIGAGTIVSETLSKKAIDAGAQFLVTPSVEPEVAEYAHLKDVPVLMGAYSPTDVSLAIKAQADIVKLFPADILGIPYMKALIGPFDHVPFFAVGGIGIENAKDWIQAGARGLGIGGKLTKLSGSDTSDITNAAKELLSILESI